MGNPKIEERKTLHPFIITSKEICNGSPVIKGTSFTHDDDFLKLAVKWSEEDKEH